MGFLFLYNGASKEKEILLSENKSHKNMKK